MIAVAVVILVVTCSTWYQSTQSTCFSTVLSTCVQLNVSLPASTRFSTEFHNPQDLVDGGSYPLDGQESEIYAEFFVYMVPIPLGPAVLIGRES